MHYWTLWILLCTNRKKHNEKLKDLLANYDDLIEEIEGYDISEETYENVKIFATNSLLVKLNDISDENKEYFIKELKKRNVVSNLKSRNIKQFLKKIYMNLYINTH